MHCARLVPYYVFSGVSVSARSMGMYSGLGVRLCYDLFTVYCSGFYFQFYLHWGIMGTL